MKTNKQSRKALPLAMISIISLTLFITTILPAHAMLTCTNLHESKVSYDRECGKGLQVAEGRFRDYVQSLNAKYGNNSAISQEDLNDYHNSKQWIEQKRRSCQSAKDSYKIFKQMANEQGLNCNQQNSDNTFQPPSQTNSNKATCPPGTKESSYDRSRCYVISTLSGYGKKSCPAGFELTRGGRCAEYVDKQ